MQYPPEKAMAPYSSTLAWKIPWMKEPGGLQSMRSLRIRHDWATSLSLFSFMHWRRKWQPTPVFLPAESQGLGAWWAAVSGVAQSRTRLKRQQQQHQQQYPHHHWQESQDANTVFKTWGKRKNPQNCLTEKNEYRKETRKNKGGKKVVK